VLEARSGTKFLTISANPTFWTFFGSHKELGGASYNIMFWKTFKKFIKYKKILDNFVKEREQKIEKVILNLKY
jgi:hypothetical protein